MSRRAVIRVTQEQARFLAGLLALAGVPCTLAADRVTRGLAELGEAALFEFEKRKKGRERKKRARAEKERVYEEKGGSQ